MNWKELLKKRKTIVIIIAIILVALIVWVIKKRKNGTQTLVNKVFGNDKTELKEATDALNQSTQFQRSIEQNATISRDTAQDLAKKIKGAWGGIWNDDEEAVYSALRKLNNKADWLLLVQEYGVNSGTFTDKDLVGDLESRLSDAEFANCKSILRTRGISI